MSTIDLSTITGLTVQINALQQSKNSVTDPAAKALLDAQIAMLSAQLSAAAQHAQAQSDAQSNILDNLGLFATLSSTVGNAAPSIIALFKR
jgi:hypothetical protein